MFSSLALYSFYTWLMMSCDSLQVFRYCTTSSLDILRLASKVSWYLTSLLVEENLKRRVYWLCLLWDWQGLILLPTHWRLISHRCTAPIIPWVLFCRVVHYWLFLHNVHFVMKLASTCAFMEGQCQNKRSNSVSSRAHLATLPLYLAYIKLSWVVGLCGQLQCGLGSRDGAF